jgi:hypothetical protein
MRVIPGVKKKANDKGKGASRPAPYKKAALRGVRVWRGVVEEHDGRSNGAIHWSGR